MVDEATQDQLKFVEVDLTELMNEGVLMAANERFFWPFGLALTWEYDKATGIASGLHVRQWTHPENARERIDLDPVDEIGNERRQRFAQWASQRVESMIPEERKQAMRVMRRL